MAKQTDIRRWALIGAEQRLLQLAEEAATIHRAFPELQQVKAQGGRRGKKVAAEKAFSKPRKRRKMSAAARKRIGDAQRARWAKQKAGSTKKR